MSVSVNVKVEAGSSIFENGEDEQITDFPLNLSNKNMRDSENTADNDRKMQPEFVNIKMEMDIETNIKQERNLDSESAEPDSIRADVAIKTEPLDEGYCKIEITLDETSNDTRPKDENVSTDSLLVERISVPNTSNDDRNEVTEDALNLNAVEDGKYMCPVCQKRFANKSNVQRHQLLHTRQKLVCQICNRNFMKAAHLERHIMSHAVVKTYPCLECGKVFRSSSNLEQHKKTHLSDKPYKCDVCKRQFSVKHNLIKHQGTKRCKMPIDKPIVCDICGKGFKKEFLLRSHLRKHTTERPFTCDICKMSFKYKSTLDRHIQLHNGLKPYSCKVCMKTFTHAGLIKPHMRKHTGEKPYSCPVCTKAFAHKHNMERHTLRHSKVKLLDCHICHKRFPKESRLIYHMRTHVNEKPFACKICPKKFSHRQNVVRHYGRKHPGQVCDIPDTDASVARIVWENVMQKKEIHESKEEYIIP